MAATQLIYDVKDTDLTQAIKTVRQYRGLEMLPKFGLPFVLTHGVTGLRHVVDECALGSDFMLDLKLADTPGTVEAAMHAILSYVRPRLLTIYGRVQAKSLVVARATLDMFIDEDIKLIATTCLTSETAADIKQLAGRKLATQLKEVQRIGQMALDAGADGLVCSGHEVAELRTTFGNDVILLTPGIRPPGYPPDDQQRTVTPVEAARAGADYIVMGRPLSHPAGGKTPVEVAEQVLDKLATTRPLYRQL